MTTSITWKVNTMLSIPKPGVDDFVMTVSCDVTATDGKSTINTTQLAAFDYDPENDYEPYANLTEEQVLGWVKASIGLANVARLESSLTEAVYDLSNPPVEPAANPLPWAN